MRYSNKRSCAANGVSEREDYATARSENWQESERGEEFEERLETLREVVAAVEELTPVPEKT